jgi:preprotein translocase subunit SecY
MNNFIQTLKNIWNIDELRNRISYTLLLLLAYRFASYIVLPGVVPSMLAKAGETSDQGLFGLVNAFTGGAFSQASIMALGIMPYISASIVIQLLGFAVPYFQRLQKREGESGQRLLNQYTRWLTVVITLAQSVAYLKYVTTLSTPSPISSLVNPVLFNIVGLVTLAGGTIFAMWIGERITEKGLGNGTSLLIMSGIMSRLPSAFGSEIAFRMSGATGGLVAVILELVFLVLVTGFTILLVQGVRRIMIQFAKRMVGRGEQQNTLNFGGSNDSIPIKVNASGVMPIIFAQALMFLPAFVMPYFSTDMSGSFANFSKFTSVSYNVVYFILIVVFTYVYTALLVNANQYADFLKRSNAFIPGVQPGEETANFIDTITARITLPGAIGLGIVAILPAIVAAFGVNESFAMFFGGSSLIILVGVVLDTLQQIEGHLLMQRYDGLVKSGSVGREASTEA